MKRLDVYAFNTRFEIHNYEPGDLPRVESDLSLWDDVYHRKIPRYHYDENNHILYIPRGYDVYKLEALVGKSIVYKRVPNEKKKVTFPIKTPPRDDVQKESVRFLTGMEEYAKMMGESQQVLSLPTSAGKTYCTIAACSVLGVRSLIIVGTDDLRKQWRNKIMEYTGLPSSSICTINGKPTINRLMKAKEKKLNEYVFYITTHSTLRSYIKSDGFDSLNPFLERLGIGVKIIDEAHLQYANILLIDYATNVWKSFYLTATFNQSEEHEDKLFQTAFNKVYKLKIYPNGRRHVIYIAAIFTSKANAVEKESVKGKKGLSRHKYISYELEKGCILDVYQYFIRLFVLEKKLEGKILVLSSKKESCDRLKEITDELLPNYSTCVHYSGNKVDNFESYGIIFATYLMLGTGNDISGLRVIVNLEPIRSKRNALQIWGRLRMYAPDKDTYYVEIVDKSIPQVMSMYRDRKEIFQDLAKKFLPVDFTKK